MQLRCQKQRKKRYGKTDRRGIIPNRLSIEDLAQPLSMSGAGLAIGRLIPLLAGITNMPLSASLSARPGSR